jgi:WD40 repeat protein
MPDASVDRTFRVDRRSVQSTAWSPDDNQLAGLLQDRRSGEMILSMWDMYTGEHRDVVQVDEQAFRLMWSADGSSLANFGLRVEELTQVWNTTDFSLITEFCLPFYRSAQISPDLSRVAAVDATGRLQVWDITDTETIVEQQPQWLESLISWSPDMSRLAVVAKAYNLSSVTRVWDVNEARYTHTFDGCNSQTAITWHPEGTTLAVSCWNLYRGPSAIEIWGLESGLHATLLPPSQAAMISQAFWSPDGLLIAAFGGSTPPGRDNIVENMVWIWDARTGSVLQTLHHPPTSVRVTWSPDGGMLATSTPWWMRIWRTSDLVSDSYGPTPTKTG